MLAPVQDFRVKAGASHNSSALIHVVEYRNGGGGELEYDAGSSLWKHEQYIKDFVGRRCYCWAVVFCTASCSALILQGVRQAEAASLQHPD